MKQLKEKCVLLTARCALWTIEGIIWVVCGCVIVGRCFTPSTYRRFIRERRYERWKAKHPEYARLKKCIQMEPADGATINTPAFEAARRAKRELRHLDWQYDRAYHG